MVLVQKWPFFLLSFFRQYSPGKCLLPYSRTKKTPSRLQEQEIQKLEKLTYGFGAKNLIFLVSFFRQYRSGKCLLRYSRTKKRLSTL